MDNCIGEYGVCIDDESEAHKGKLLYLIAGKYAGGEVPEGMMLYEFPQSEWAIFDCVGAIPNALQSLNTQIFKEWLPLNKDFELRKDADPQNFINLLYKKTRLEDTFGFNMLAISKGRPETLGLKQVIKENIDFQFEINTRKYTKLLEKELEKKVRKIV